MKRLIILGLMCVLCSISVQAQFGYYNDALLFSKTGSIGTARTQAIGGAQAALGGDVNAAHANPAGLGFNRSSVVTFTPSLNFYNSSSEYFGEYTDDFKTNFNIANLGVIFNFANSDIEQSKFKGGSFAITMTRENNFHSDIRYDAYNDSEFGSSIVDMYLDNVNYPDPNADISPVSIDELTDFEFYGLYEQYLINPNYTPDINGEDSLTHYFKFIGDNPRQVETYRTTGNQNQWDFAYGGNYDDVLYFGASLGINSINYKTKAVFTESEFLLFDDTEETSTADDAINHLTTIDELSIRGIGISGTFGLIARPSDYFRVGITAVTPTYYTINEESSVDMFVRYNNFELFEGEERLNDYYDQVFFESNYKLRTPFKITTGAAFFLGKFGFISADVDFFDYSTAKIKSNDFNVSEDNQSIKTLYKNTVNFRVGSEIRIDPFRLRGGYSYEGDPYVSSTLDNSIRKISGGIGFRAQEFFVDVSAVHSKWNSIRSPYEISGLAYPTANVENKNLNVSVTVGVNF